MLNTHFTNRDVAFLAVGIVFALLAVIFFSRGKIRLSVVLLIASGLTFRLMMAFIDPFVNIWDEQYHALVAKNLAEHFFHPTLVEQPLLPLTAGYYAFTETWLNKPPLFLWQMAISIKIFGAHPWAIRIPSVILSTLMIPAIYRCGKIISGERTGLFAALMLTCSNIHINIVSGWMNTDQNDAVFAAYVFLSFWSWMEYINAPNKKWAIITGCFVAAAVLTKWLPGLLVLGTWGAVTFLYKSTRTSLPEWKNYILATVVTAVLASPWFIYASGQWPDDWAATLSLYRAHMTDNLGHPGSWLYHFAELQEQNGTWFVVALVPAMILFIRDNVHSRVRAGMFIAIITVFAFYCFVPTKMPFFCFPVLPLLILMVAHMLQLIPAFIRNHNIKAGNIAGIAISIVLIFTLLDFGRLEHYHSDRDPKEFYRKTRINNRKCFERAAKNLPPNTVIFNCGAWNAVPCMFYTSFTAYDGLPTSEQIEAAKKQGRPIALFPDADTAELIIIDAEVIYLNEPLIRNGF